MILTGGTFYLQGLDLCINKPFKDAIRSEINNYLKMEQRRNAKGNLTSLQMKEAFNGSVAIGTRVMNILSIFLSEEVLHIPVFKYLRRLFSSTDVQVHLF